MSESAADVRARARLHVIRQALAYARERQAVCAREAERYAAEKPDEPHWAASERCAMAEARHIAEMIEQLWEASDREAAKAYRDSRRQPGTSADAPENLRNPLPTDLPILALEGKTHG